MTATAGIRPRRLRRVGGNDRDFGLDAGGIWPQPTWVPQTAPGVAVLDDFNVGATQVLNNRPGWSLTGVVNTSDVGFRTDATPTFCDATFTPASNHGNVWDTKFNRNREVWCRFTTGPVTSSMTLQIMSANQATFAPAHQLLWAPSGQFVILSNNTNSGSVQLPAGPAVGDMMAFQREFPYLFGWVKLAAGSWTFVLSVTDASLPNDGWIGMFLQNPGTVQIDQFGGGSFFSSTTQHQQVLRRAWAGRS